MRGQHARDTTSYGLIILLLGCIILHSSCCTQLDTQSVHFSHLVGSTGHRCGPGSIEAYHIADSTAKCKHIQDGCQQP